MDPRLVTAARVAQIAPFHVMEVQTAARALEAAGRSVVHMEIGEPDFHTPVPVIAAAQRAIAAGDIYYTSALGLPALREAIARHYADHYGAKVAPERIVVTAGSSAALLLVLALLVDRDDEVLLADPNYPCNRHFVRTLEGCPVGIAVGPDSHYQLTAELVEQHWTPHARAALVASPSNPTGTTIDRDEMTKIARAIAARGGQLIVDEIYLGLSYDLGERQRPRSAVDIGDDVFVISSFSKHFNMTGWRLGWAVVPERHVRDIEKLAQNLYISPATPSQRAALACFLPETLDIVEARRREFEARRDLLVPALRDLGFRIPVLPTGGFFVYADTSALATDSATFCRELLAATGVALTPGLDFGTHRASGHVRFAYTIAQAKIEDGIERLARHLRRR